MTDIDPTLLPPHWTQEFDSEQHKILTEHGLMDFFENRIEEEVSKFRDWEEEAELPESVRMFREVLAEEQKRNHRVRVQDIGMGCDYRNEQVAVNSATEMASGRQLFVGLSSLAATVVSVFDQGNSGGTGALVGSWNVGPAATPLWLDRGIKCRNGIYIVSTVATSVTCFFRELED